MEPPVCISLDQKCAAYVANFVDIGVKLVYLGLVLDVLCLDGDPSQPMNGLIGSLGCAGLQPGPSRHVGGRQGQHNHREVPWVWRV
mgnify:CR=1 FL=1